MLRSRCLYGVATTNIVISHNQHFHSFALSLFTLLLFRSSLFSLFALSVKSLALKECVAGCTSSFFFMIRTRLKYFCIWGRFCRDIQIFKKLRGVLPTTETDSAVSNIPRSPQWAAPRGELHPGVSCTPWSQAPLYASHCGVKLCSVHHTTESSDEQFSKNSVVCIPTQNQSLVNCLF